MTKPHHVPSRPTQAEHSWKHSGQFFDDVPIREDRNQRYEVFSGEHNTYPKEPGQATFEEASWRYNGPLGGVRMTVTDTPHDLDHIREHHPEMLEEARNSMHREVSVVVHRDTPWWTTQELHPDTDGRYYRPLEGPHEFDYPQTATFDVMEDGMRVYALLQSAYRRHLGAPIMEVSP